MCVVDTLQFIRLEVGVLGVFGGELGLEGRGPDIGSLCYNSFHDIILT